MPLKIYPDGIITGWLNTVTPAFGCTVVGWALTTVSFGRSLYPSSARSWFVSRSVLYTVNLPRHYTCLCRLYFHPIFHQSPSSFTSVPIHSSPIPAHLPFRPRSYPQNCLYSSLSVFDFIPHEQQPIDIIWRRRSWRHDICIAPFRENSYLKRSEWHVLTKDHTVLPAAYTSMHEWNEPPCLYFPAAVHHPHFGRVLISRPTEGRRLSWPGWLVTYRRGMPPRRRSPIPVPADRYCGGRGSNSRPLSRN